MRYEPFHNLILRTLPTGSPRPQPYTLKYATPTIVQTRATPLPTRHPASKHAALRLFKSGSIMLTPKHRLNRPNVSYHLKASCQHLHQCVDASPSKHVTQCKSTSGRTEYLRTVNSERMNNEPFGHTVNLTITSLSSGNSIDQRA